MCAVGTNTHATCPTQQSVSFEVAGGPATFTVTNAFAAAVAPAVVAEPQFTG
jgi:hypothetical protein